MTEGRKCHINEETGYIQAATTAPNGRAFTLAEIEEMKAEIHTQCFGAGVEAAIHELNCYIGSDQKCFGCQAPKGVLNLLPPGYKSPAEIRRETLEATFEVLDSRGINNSPSWWQFDITVGENIAIAIQKIRALAEGWE